MADNSLKPALIGLVVGAIASAGILVGGGVAVMNTEAKKMATKAGQEALSDGYVAICVTQFEADPDRAEHLKTLQDTAIYSRDEFVGRRGWATMPGSNKPYRNVPEYCAAAIIEANK